MKLGPRIFLRLFCFFDDHFRSFRAAVGKARNHNVHLRLCAGSFSALGKKENDKSYVG